LNLDDALQILGASAATTEPEPEQDTDASTD